MIIKTTRLKTFIKEYDKKIGTYYEWEKWSDTTTHVYAFDIETQEEADELDKLIERFHIDCEWYTRESRKVLSFLYTHTQSNKCKMVCQELFNLIYPIIFN